MSVRCEVWIDEATQLGVFDFAQLPRPGDTVSLPIPSGESFQHYCVETVSHRASGRMHEAATYLFVTGKA